MILYILQIPQLGIFFHFLKPNPMLNCLINKGVSFGVNMEQVLLAKNGDEEAFRKLIEESKSMLYRTAFAYTRNEDDAIEIVQETVYKAFVSINQLKEPAYFGTWLTRILINCSINYMKKQKRMILFSEPIPKYVASTNPGHVEEKMDLSFAIDQLEEKLKTVVILKYYHDLTIIQIAEILECPVGTVKTRLHMALKKLRVELKEESVNE